MTMTRLAELAGLNIATVSRALKGDTARVSAATIARVRRLADEHGYQPDPAASSLRGGRTRVLGVLVPHLTDVVMAEVFEGIAAQAADAGYLAVVTPTRESRESRRDAVETFLGRRVDGIILADASVRKPVPPELSAATVPFVLALRGSPSHLSVTADDRLGGQLAARHLLDAGHHDVVVIGGPRNVSTAVARLAGFVQAYRDAGVPIANEAIAHGEFTAMAGHTAMTELLHTSRPTAVFAANDYNAIGAARALQDAGLRIGQDVALVGYNDISISAELPVPLSTVRNELETIGRLAAQALIDLLDGRQARSHQVPPRLIIRESSAFAARNES
jgi:LacI family transcriptional regulator, galactose operon repressor